MGSSATTRIGTDSPSAPTIIPNCSPRSIMRNSDSVPLAADPDGLEPPAQDEAHRGEHDVRLVDDAAGWILRDPAEPRDFLEGLIGRTLEVFVHFQERNDLIAHGGAFRVRGGYGPRTPSPGLRSQCR